MISLQHIQYIPCQTYRIVTDQAFTETIYRQHFLIFYIKNGDFMKKNSRFLLYGAITFLFVCTAAGTSCVSSYASAVMQKTISSKEDAEAYIRELLTGDASSLDEACSYTDQMKKAVNSLGGMEGLRKSLASLGDIKEIEPASETQNGEMISYSVPCVFEAMKVDLVLTVDADRAIAGLVTGRYSGGASAAGTGGEENTEVHFISEELSIPVEAFENGELPGTLLIPEGEGPFPAVVLIHGSGPNDRDESIGENAPFKDIAEGLAESGIAVYRFDKRTYVYGPQMHEDTGITLLEETIEDAVTAVQVLASHDKIDPSRIFVLGHSLGGMSLPAIDQELKSAEHQACGYIFLAAPARNLIDIMREQYDFIYSLTPILTAEQKQQKEQTYRELDQLKNLESADSGTLIANAYPAYWNYLNEYDIIGTAENITVPCLVLQGEEDYQVTMEDFSLWQNAFKGKDTWQFRSYPGLIHLFVKGQKSNGPAAYMKAQKVEPQVLEDIASFVLAH